MRLYLTKSQVYGSGGWSHRPGGHVPVTLGTLLSPGYEEGLLDV